MNKLTQIGKNIPFDKLGDIGKQFQDLAGGISKGKMSSLGGGGMEEISCEIRFWFKLFLWIILSICIIILLPIVPFIWLSYNSFYGKYGIVKILKSINKKF